MAGTAKICGGIVSPVEEVEMDRRCRKHLSPNLLLDAHVWLWLVTGERGVGFPGSENNQWRGLRRQLRIAAATVWEVALSSRRGIVLGKPASAWVEEAVAASTVIVVPPSPSIAVASRELPGSFHADPATASSSLRRR
jgi:PIN domain nuclease of toxin-antitoxin system